MQSQLSLTSERSIYPTWFNDAIQGGLGGIMPWSLGAEDIDLTVSLILFRCRGATECDVSVFDCVRWRIRRRQ